MEKGCWTNTVSHVKTKGSGGQDWNNVIPMCFHCHRDWEDSTKVTKPLMLELAKDYTKEFRERNPL